MVQTRTRSSPSPTASKSGIATTGKPLAAGTWSYTPSRILQYWLYISLPLVLWDMGYVTLRPHSMPGGKWSLPWRPYSIYCEVDLVYGFQHYKDGEGFNPAQTLLNFFETTAYFYYLWLVGKYGVGDRKILTGKPAGLALAVGLSACVATFWKTCLYWLQEILGQYKNIGHNSASDLVWFWILPNGLWLLFPSIAIYGFLNEITEAVAVASGEGNESATTKEE